LANTASKITDLNELLEISQIRIQNLEDRVEKSEPSLRIASGQLMLQDELKNFLEKQFAKINLKYRGNARILEEINTIKKEA